MNESLTASQPRALPAALLPALQTVGRLCVEVRDGVPLAFSPQHALEDETRAGLMVTLTTALGTSGR